ncbi:MAG: cytochrome d ubiquinol oxidase subunit II [Mariniblastus sp.]
MTTVILIILLIALVLYVVLGGADFGAGIWEFNTAFRSNERERELLYHAIGPVWETNHVWLIFIMVLLFGAFPPAFAAMNEALFLPLMLALIGIVFRGAAYAFRSQLKLAETKRLEHLSRASVVLFGLSSVLAPFFLGASVGALASGELGFNSAKEFTGSFLTDWIDSFSIFCGFFTVGLCAYTSSTYMIREARSSQLDAIENIWRKRSLFVGSLLGGFAVFGLVLAATKYPVLWEGLKTRGWPAIGLSMFLGFLSLWLIHRRKINASVICVSGTCATVVVGWGLAQYPFLVPLVWSVQDAASPPSVLRLLLWTIGIGSCILLPALLLLFKIFKSDEQ